MIKKVELINFKSHKNTVLNLENLTVLCGQNGTGKSSFIQSLLLLRQSNLKNRLDKVLDLNDPLCYLGKAQDVFYQFAEKGKFEDKIKIMISDSLLKNYSWEFDVKGDATFLNRVSELTESEGFSDLSLFSANFQYISAARNLESVFPDDYAVTIEKQISQKEGKGELTAQYLYQWGVKQKIQVHSELIHDSEYDSENNSLLDQVSAWEKEISKGVNIIPQLEGNNYVIRYKFDAEVPTDEFSSRNVGFGLSYSLPVVTAILSAQPGSLLFIENPEAHVHPYGQSKLAELICKAAQAGIQLIVETHSDHIINGILVQCKKYEEKGSGINREHARIYYFDRDDKYQATFSQEIKIEEGGKIKGRPIGFFDQIGKDLRKLI